MSDAGKPKKVSDLGVSPGSKLGVDPPDLSSNGNHSSEFLDQFAALIADTVPQSIWVTDSEGNVKFLNKHWYDYSGTSERPITAAEVAAESVHPEDAPALLSAFQNAIQTGTGFEVEQRNLAANGEYRWFLNRANPYRDPDSGEIKFWLGVSVDIHDRKVGRDDERFLFEISELIRVADNLEELLGEISDRLGRYLGAHRCLFNEIDLGSDTETVHRDFARDGESVAGKHKVSVYSAEASEAMSTGKAIINHDSEKDPRTAAYFEQTYKPAKELAYITVPMMRDGRWVASLWCSDDRPRQWSSREVTLLENIAERTWAAVERLRAQNALRESEARFRNMADYAPVMIWVTDAGGNCTFLSRSWYDFTGQTEETGLGFGWLRATHPDDMPRAEEVFLKANTKREPFTAEYRLRRADGEYRWTIDSARPRFSDAGVFLGFIGSVIDISDRKSIEDGLKRSEEEFRTVADAAPALVWATNEKGEPTYFNERWYKYTGLTPEESSQNGWASVVPQDDLAVLLPKWERSRATGEPYEGECRYRGANGEYRWHTFRALPRRSENGEITGWYGVSVDVHEGKAVADRVRLSEERYRALTELSPQMVYMSRPDGSITYVNQYATEWTGKPSEDLKGEGWGELIHPDHRERIFNVWKTAVAVASEYEIDIPFRHVDGTYRTLYNRALPIKDENDEVLYWIGTALDVEDRKRAEEQLRESEQRFRQVSDSAPVLIWMSDTTKKFIWFNKPWLDFTGRTMEDESREGWFEGVHPEDKERCWNVYSMSFKNKQEFAMEYRLRRADGEYRWLLDRGVPRLTPDGTFLGFIGSCIDIHDRRAAESALRRSEARLQLATQLGGYGTWDINAAESRHIWSDKLFEIFGIVPTPDRSVTNELFERYIYPEDLQKLQELNAKAQTKREHFTTEYRIRRADTGEMRWVDVAAQHFFDSEGTLLRTIGIAQDITERRLANEAIRASEERLTLAQQAGNVGVWDWDASTNLTFWSEQMWAFYGEKPQEFGPPHESWIERLHPGDRGRIDEAVKSSLESDANELKEEFRIYRKDGELRWLEVIANIERDGSGAATRMYGVNLDITERKSIAERIRSSEAQLRLVTDSIPALVSYIDREEKYRFVNQRYSEWFGLDRDEIMGHTMEDVLGSAAMDQLRPRIEEVLLGNTISFESWVDYRAAGRKFVHISYVPDRHDSGEAAGFYALVTDLTAQKLSEEMLRSTEDRMRIISESFTDYAILSMDAEGRVESWNPGAENIFGYAADEIIGRPASVLFTPEDAARGVPAEELRQAEERGRASDERWHMRKDGTRFYASGVAAPLYVGDRLTGFAKIATDLTEKKRNAEALQRAYDEMENRVLERTRELASMNETLMREISERQTAERQKIELLKRLVSGQEEERRRIARDLHDHLGQRLTALRLKLASLREACGSDGELYERATRLQQIAELIDSEVSFLAWELRPSTLDELGLIDAIGAFVKEWSRHYDINAEFHSTGLGDVRLDREAETHLYRITQEALNNIYKHANAHNVSVLIERAGREVILIVEDDGTGFTQPDTQRDRTSNRGLGLGGMRERADLIGGTLEIESEVGKGATIYVRIPVEPDQRIER